MFFRKKIKIFKNYHRHRHTHIKSDHRFDWCLARTYLLVSMVRICVFANLNKFSKLKIIFWPIIFWLDAWMDEWKSFRKNFTGKLSFLAFFVDDNSHQKTLVHKFKIKPTEDGWLKCYIKWSNVMLSKPARVPHERNPWMAAFYNKNNKTYGSMI